MYSKSKRSLLWAQSIFLLFHISCGMIQPDSLQLEEPHSLKLGDKIKGVALESPAREGNASLFQELKSLGTNSVCLMPYAFALRDSMEVTFDSRYQWWGERTEGILRMIEDARASGLEIMLKPHIWLGHGGFTGELRINDSEKQEVWNDSYRAYILHYARIAEEMDVELFCIGTELCYQVNDEPDYWLSLIEDVRSVYSGPLTYASNWDCFAGFPHWDALDLIGIDAYFPLEGDYAPDHSNPVISWAHWKDEMRSVHQETGKDILFTEFRYRRTSFCMEEPWEMSRKGEENPDNQRRALELLFQEVWDEPWMEGGYLWKWHYPDHLRTVSPTSYTVQGKTAIHSVSEAYSPKK